jgi:hypothetical protein
MAEKLYDEGELSTWACHEQTAIQSDPLRSTVNESKRVFYVGQNVLGHWVVKSRGGLRGGVFGSKAGAFKFVLLESGSVRDYLVIQSESLELYPL